MHDFIIDPQGRCRILDNVILLKKASFYCNAFWSKFRLAGVQSLKTTGIKHLYAKSFHENVVTGLLCKITRGQMSIS